jgi:hypothetical protein
MLKFSFGNRKMHELAKHLGMNKNQVCTFDLPAGYTCPCANLCKSYANKITGKITDGKDMVFRCYAASGEAVYTNVRKLRWHNFDELQASSDMVSLIEESLPNKMKVIRIHSSGDFYSLDYFKAWYQVACNHPEITFFGYTKVLPYVQALKPDNFRLIYSMGGVMDAQVTDEPTAKIVKTLFDAETENLPVACVKNPSDDFDLIMRGISFALVLHGTQPAKA